MPDQAGGAVPYSWDNNLDTNQMMSGIGSAVGGMTANSGAPYGSAMSEYEKWANKGQEAQNPFYNAGVQGVSGYQDWLKQMQDPSGFINNIMGQYQQSPYAKYQQQQSMRTANNMGSASGLSGSTPLQLQAQQNAQNISSGDMSSWMQNVLGVNSQYGQGQNNLMNMGANSANQLTNMYNQYGQLMGDAAYGQKAGENQDESNIWGGILGTAGTVVGSMYGGPVGGAIGGSIGSSIGGSF